MRTLGATLTAAQKAMGDAKCKILLATPANVAAETYYIDSGTDRILRVEHIEQEWSQVAQIIIQDSSHTVADLDREGYRGFIYYGYGSNYSACAQLEIIAQKTDSFGGGIVTSYSLVGIFDMMGEDHASEGYSPEDTEGGTIKQILEAIADARLPGFRHCKIYTVTFDTGYDAGDDLANTVKPKDYFSVLSGETRLSAFKKALAFTNLKARIEWDGEIHIFAPTTSGSRDYDYEDVVTEHNFFEKSVRKRLTLPNKQTVRSHPDHEVQYTGTATDATSYAALGRYIEGAPFYIRATSDAQCLSIAEAKIANYQLDSERGHGFAPMNCGQEVMDYVGITDSRVDDSVTGNIGYINREYSQGKFTMEFRFGRPSLGGVARPAFPIDGTVSYADLLVIIDYINDRIIDLARWFSAGIIDLKPFDFPEVIPKLHVEKQLIIPVIIPGAPIVTSEAVSDILTTTATGNGTITDLGVPDPTAHGVCYNTTGDPYITDSVTDEGAATLTGAYTTAMTGLTADTKYYVRAYATNTTGTGYGVQVTFTTTA